MPEEKPTINVLVEDEFTKAVLGSYSYRKPLRLRFSGTKQNLVNELEYIEKSINGKVHPLVLDLYQIALVVYVWDLNTQRSGREPRDFRALIPVSNKDKWIAVKNHLEAMLGFLTGDNFTFHFAQGNAGEQGFEVTKSNETSISLFSGGLDSLAGVKWLVDAGKKPLLTSHQPAGLVSGAQKELVNKLHEHVGEIDWYQIRAAAKARSGLRGKVYTQFSRSFLYLTLGSLFALQLGIDQIYIFENGTLALNIPLTQSRIYSNTRTVHPRFLQDYEKLLSDLFGSHVRIENPFVNKTKGEVVKLLDAEGFRELLKVTVSCPELRRLSWQGVKVSVVRHCGICFPCIIRRIAVHNAGLWESDGQYNMNVFGDWSKLSDEARRLLLEMRDFGKTIDSFSTVDDAVAEIHQFYTHESIDPALSFDMIKRHVQQMKDCFSTRGSQNLKSALDLA